MNSLTNLIWHKAVNMHTFFPRCFDLTQPEEYEDFLQEYKSQKACGILKAYVREMR
jgi:tubulin monoglycylase TTLL3/8